MPTDTNLRVPTRRNVLKQATLVGAGVAALGPAACVDTTTSGRTTRGTSACDGTPRANPDQDTAEVRWGFLVDHSRCRGCDACAVACKTQSDVRLGVFRSGVIKGERGDYPNTRRVFIPWLCSHCREPLCLERCPVEPVKATLTFEGGESIEYWRRATYQRPDGLVLVDQDRCVGCGYCVEDCPYGARYLDWSKAAGGDPASVGMNIVEPHPADKCDLCVARLQNGLVPACVNTCPSEARLVGNLNDPDSEINQRLADASDVTTLLPAVGTRPQVFYIGLGDDQDVYLDGHDIRVDALRQYDTPGV